MKNKLDRYILMGQTVKTATHNIKHTSDYPQAKANKNY